jgi:hypothetical protein
LDGFVFIFLTGVPAITVTVVGKGTKVVEAHYLSTGRLSSLRGTVRRAFRFLLLQLSVPPLAAKAWEAMEALAQLEADHGEFLVCVHFILYQMQNVFWYGDAVDECYLDLGVCCSTTSLHPVSFGVR